eukprot:Amastigsp_a175739_228.p3 type:complete len:106 gc:universal Amastigsp_a175739_228:491-174(-)
MATTPASPPQKKKSSFATPPPQDLDERPQPFWTPLRVIGSMWAGSVAAAFLLQPRHLKLSQRVVQARVYAQFLTVGAIVAAASVSIFGDEARNMACNQGDRRSQR